MRLPGKPHPLSRGCGSVIVTERRAPASGLAVLLLLAAVPPLPGATFSFHAAGDRPGSWPAILSSLGLTPGPSDPGVIVVPTGVLPDAGWAAKVERGTILVLEGESALAASFGFQSTSQRVVVRSVEDLRAPKLKIVWEKPLEIRRFEVPPQARVFARERREQAPLIAGFRRGAGAVLWVAVPPGEHGYERFPYLPQALADLGLYPPFRSSRLWAFFDSSYRARVDLDYFAPRWRAAGISALHIAAWHYWERNPQADDYLRRLIDACHRNAIQVYAWFELPHVSDRFWEQHPEWRERTALLQDAQLDWRKLINLTNRPAFQAVSAGLRDLVERFDWDGVNLAELYFESLEGHENAARFTPMNTDVRAQFRTASGFDPVDLFDQRSPRHYLSNSPGLAQFLEFRAELARRQQAEWIAQIDEMRKTKPYLDLALTHIDDRFDTSMREKLGADVTKTLPLLDRRDFTFLIEDPSTIWSLGPQRYPQIAARYAGITPRPEKLAIDVNIVERYQDVYPTKVQTGAELFALVHTAVAAFPRVALYFENSIAAADWGLLPFSAGLVSRFSSAANRLEIESVRGVGVARTGAVLVDGRLWPFADSQTAWLPPGRHTIEPAAAQPPLRLLDLNADLKAASLTAAHLEFAYESSARAMARFDQAVTRIEVDGVEARVERAGDVLLLPRGQHYVSATIPQQNRTASPLQYFSPGPAQK